MTFLLKIFAEERIIFEYMTGLTAFGDRSPQGNMSKAGSDRAHCELATITQKAFLADFIKVEGFSIDARAM
ncbi:hypothetical protein WSS15_11210 [Acetobacter pasteurianus]|nr:hypothetical protein WSS15_11210 [Acetobacter pasteurianus]